MLVEMKTALQTAGDIESVLDWKVSEIQGKNLPMSCLSDYIIMGLTGFDDDIEKLDNYIEQLKQAMEELKDKKDKASIECSKYLSKNGIDKLEATLNGFSSITTTKPKEGYMKQTRSFECSLTPAEQKDLLVNDGYAEWQTHDIKVEDTASKIKVNKRRV